MKLNKIILLSAAVGLTALSFTTDKKAKPFEGKITFEINYDELPEAIEPYRAMLPKETVTYVKGPKTRVEQTTMGTTVVTVVNSEKKTGFMLMDQFGGKTAYTMDAKDFDKDAKTPENMEVTYTKETKEIAGYKCTKAEIKDKKDGNVMTAWVTDEISGSNKQLSYLKGYPLEYTVKAQMGMTMTMKAKTIDKTKVEDGMFEIPKDYTQKPMSDLQKQMQQMQGGGDE